MFFFFTHLRKQLKRHQPFYWFFSLLVIFFSLFLLHMFFFVLAEKIPWDEALWQTWQTFTTVGYGNRPAETWLGRLNSMFFSTLGIAVMGTLFAAAFEMRLYFNNLRRYGQMKNPFRDGYVVAHYPGEDNFATFVNEIRSLEPEVGICILDPNLEEIPASLTHLKRLHLVRGSCTSRNHYQKAGLRDNKAVIVFSPQINISGADAMTKTVVNLISQFLEGSQTRLIHMLEDAQNDWMFASEKSVQIIEDLNILAAVQECSDPYSSKMIERMLRNTVGPSIKTVQLKHVIGWPWSKFCLKLLEFSIQQNKPITPIGLIRDGQALACPTPGETIIKDDACALISAIELDWLKIEVELK